MYFRGEKKGDFIFAVNEVTSNFLKFIIFDNACIEYVRFLISKFCVMKSSQLLN
jgi:hypothetical protein